MSNTIFQVDLSCSPRLTRNLDNSYRNIDVSYIYSNEFSSDNNKNVKPISADAKYSSILDHISTESVFFNNHIEDEYEVLKSFANKILAEVTPIDEEIQEVINNHFWDMI